jgi:nucleoid-associated protein YgaU
VQQAVLDFDQEVQAPWRPRLVAVPDPVEAARPLRPHPSRRSPSRVGVCAPPAPSARPVAPARRAAPREQAARDGSRRPGVRVAVPAGRHAPSRRPVSVAEPVRLRLTRRAKRLAVVLALAAGVALGSWLGPLLGGSGNELRLAGESSVIVRSGDTLWSIATALQSDGDVRALVDEIQRLNGLEGAELVPGQVLELP